jgi:succinate dehydrogenase/fumarate reductase flavoprotein subunit
MGEISRRRFLTGGVAVVGAASLGMLAGCSSQDGGSAPGGSQSAADITWDAETDVVVVGFGGAGASAAIGASDAGASVILLEKAPEKDAGGNTSVSGGGGLYPTEDKVQEAFEFLRFQMPKSIIDDEEIHGFVDELVSEVQWLEDHGATVDVIDGTPGGAMYAHHPLASGLNKQLRVGGNGAGLFKFLKGATEGSAGVEIRYETPATRLLFNAETKEVFGVVAQGPGGEVNIKAKKGVVLACGGFENDPFMRNTFYAPEVPIYPCGTPYNTGDGLRMVEPLGVKLRGFSSIEWGCHCCKPASEEVGVHVGFTFLGLEPWANAIMTNDQGKRFVNETQPVVGSFPIILRPLHEKSQIPELAFDMDTLRYTNLPMYMVFGETRINAGPLFNGASKNAGNHWTHIHDWYTWSDDNQVEITKGWITKADSLEELATKLNIDPAGLKATVEAYDAACASGSDAEFGRTEILSPIGNGPFYGCEMGLGIINTQGGPARDAAHHVLDWDNKPIPRLYSAGEFGSIYVFLYQGAGNVSEIFGGRVAGANAAAEQSWS